MSAQVLVGLEELESQQHHIINSGKDNSIIVDHIKEGMKENLEIIKQNLGYIKSKTNKTVSSWIHSPH